MFIFLLYISSLAYNIDFLIDVTTEAFVDSIPPVSAGSADWADYDGNGLSDLLLTGLANSGRVFKLYSQQTANNFVDITNTATFPGGIPPGVRGSFITWCDLFNDGRPGFLMLGDGGSRVFRVYRQNIPGQFVNITNSTYFPSGIPPGVERGIIRCVDFNKDGRMDFLVSGSNQFSTGVIGLYSQVTDNIFENIVDSSTFPNGLLSMLHGDAQFVDYDNNGFPDIVMSGYTGSFTFGNKMTKLYSQLSNSTFYDITPFNFPPFASSRITWTDFNNDNKLDLSMTGSSDTTGRTFKLFQQQNATDFVDVSDTWFPGMNVSNGDLDWTHFNNDEYPDLFITGVSSSNNYISSLYQHAGSIYDNITTIYHFPGGVPRVMYDSFVIWYDYNNDNMTDLLVAGWSNIPYLKLYRRGCLTGQYLDGSTCQVCNGFVFADQRTCGVCPQLTFANSSSVTCDTCPSPFTPSSDQQKCVECEPSKYYSVDRCIDCKLGQVHTSDSLVCEPCPNNQFLNVSSLNCELCPSAFVQDNLINCKICQNNTYFSEATLQCTRCPFNQIPTNNQLNCVFCDSGLVADSTQTTCIPCKEGSTYSSGSRLCERPSKSSSNSNVGVIAGSIAGSIGGVGLIVLLIGCCCCCILFILFMLLLVVLIILIFLVLLVVIVLFAGFGGLGVVYVRRNKAKITIDELEFGNLLGQGAFGSVYSGKYKDREVAIKKIEVLLNDNALNDFEREADILSKLSHPNIIGYIGTIITNDMCYLILELADTGSLDHLYTSIEFKDKIKFAYQVADGLEYLHSKGIIHRDLSCRNVLVSNGVAKITDFGLSRILENPNMDGNHTKTDIGPIRWLPIEFIIQKRYSKSGDIYMLGMFLYELLSEHPPYHNLNIHDVVPAIRSGVRPILDSQWSIDIRNLLNKCWSDIEDERPDLVYIKNVLTECGDIDNCPVTINYVDLNDYE